MTEGVFHIFHIDSVSGLSRMPWQGWSASPLARLHQVAKDEMSIFQHGARSQGVGDARQFVSSRERVNPIIVR